MPHFLIVLTAVAALTMGFAFVALVAGLAIAAAAWSAYADDGLDGALTALLGAFGTATVLAAFYWGFVV